MAKRKKPQVRDEGKTRVELRFDDDLYAKVKATADDAGISVNQLLQGITRWAMGRAHVGDPQIGYTRHGTMHSVETEDRPGVVWFGRSGSEDVVDDQGEQLGTDTKVEFDFALDFTERQAIRRA